MCNLVAQAFLEAEKNSDVAIQNGGGCSSDIAQGNFTIADAWNVLPYSKTLVILEVIPSITLHSLKLPSNLPRIYLAVCMCAELHGC